MLLSLCDNRFFHKQLKTDNRILTADTASTEQYCLCNMRDDGILVICNVPSISGVTSVFGTLGQKQ